MTRRTRALGIALVAVALPLLTACGGDDDDGVDGDAVADVRDALGDELQTTLATMLYENPGSRDYFLEQVRQDDPDVWEEIDSDGDVTLEEFRSIPDVQDAVNHYGGDVMQFFQDQMVAAES